MDVATRTRTRTSKRPSRGRTSGANRQPNQRRPSTWGDRIERLIPPPIRGIVERARRDDIPLFAAALGFYALVSVVPL
ncbi:MAG TPA: hypothetical protein VKK30_06185, partial [Actinomycetota bacterium]|nr:hypothetical protein [Actinomycetota bacterium]